MPWTIEGDDQGLPQQPKKPTPPALDTINKYESGGKNVPNYAYDKGHTAGGYLQITDTNWKKYAPGLGIDVEKYPNAMSAPKDTQYQVGAKMYAETGYAPWAPYNSRLAEAVGLKSKGWSVTGSGKWNVDDKAIQTEQGRSDTQVVWRDPDDFLAELPEMDDEKEPAGARQKQELDESLNRGDKIEEIPHVDVRTKNGKAEVVDYDGRHRAQRAIEEGVTLIPVSYRGIPKGETVTEFKPMRGEARKWDFKAVDPVTEQTITRDVNAAHLATAQGKTLYNEAGLPFNQSGPVATQPEQPRLPGEIPYIGTISSMIADIVRGAVEGGEMARGARPVTENLPPEVISSAAALGGAPLPPASRFTPGVNALRAGPSMSENAATLFQRGPPSLERITPERAALAKDALDRGIPVTGPQNAAAQVAKDRALATAVSHTFGEDAPALTADVLSRAQKRIGDGLNQIEQGHSLPFDPEFRSDMIAVSNEAKSQLPTPGQIRVVEKHLKDIMVDPVKTEAAKKAAASVPKTPGKPAAKPKEVLRSGLSGEQFASLIHEKGPIGKLTNNPDPHLALFGDKIEEALRDLLQRRLPTDKAAEYQGLRYQYKNLKTAEKAVGPTGEVDPGKLDTAVNRSFPNRKRDKGAELVRLADIGKEFVTKPPSEAAPSRLGRNMLRHGIAAVIGHSLGGIPGAVGAVAGEHLLRRMFQPRLTESLIRRALATQPPPGARVNAIKSILAQSSSNTLRTPFRAPTSSLLSGGSTATTPQGTGP